MIYLRTHLTVADNSGVKRVWAIGVLGRGNKLTATVGDVVKCHIKEADPDVLAKKGERVFRGQNLVVIESMKMESGVASPCDGIVESVSVSAGQAVEADEILIRFKA